MDTEIQILHNFHLTKYHYSFDFFPQSLKKRILSLQAVQKQVSELSSANSCPSTESPSGQGILPVLLITPSQNLSL